MPVLLLIAFTLYLLALAVMQACKGSGSVIQSFDWFTALASLETPLVAAVVLHLRFSDVDAFMAGR